MRSVMSVYTDGSPPEGSEHGSRQQFSGPKGHEGLSVWVVSSPL